MEYKCVHQINKMQSPNVTGNQRLMLDKIQDINKRLDKISDYENGRATSPERPLFSGDNLPGNLNVFIQLPLFFRSVVIEEYLAIKTILETIDDTELKDFMRGDMRDGLRRRDADQWLRKNFEMAKYFKPQTTEPNATLNVSVKYIMFYAAKRNYIKEIKKALKKKKKQRKKIEVRMLLNEAHNRDSQPIGLEIIDYVERVISTIGYTNNSSRKSFLEELVNTDVSDYIKVLRLIFEKTFYFHDKDSMPISDAALKAVKETMTQIEEDVRRSLYGDGASKN